MLELGKHQLKAVKELKNGRILKGGVGSGKSRTALYYYLKRVCKGDVKLGIQGENHVVETIYGDYAPMESPRDLYIITTAKKRNDGEWLEEAADILISSDPATSHSGVKLTIDSWNNITKYADVRGAHFLFDEQKLVGSGAWVKAFLAIAKHNTWTILSATPGDVWMDYVPVFLAHGFYKNRTEFIRQHVVYNQHFTSFPKIDRYINEGLLLAYRREVVVDMPYKRHTRRQLRLTPVEYSEELWNTIVKDRWHPYEDRPIKDVAELYALMRRIVNIDPSRLEAVKKTMEKHPRLIVFYNFNYELDLLREFLDGMDVVYAEWNGQKHEEVPTGDKWVYLVQYQAGAEGWNCTTTDAELSYSLNYSYKLFEQFQGRIDRLNTPYTDLFYYILKSDAKIDNMIWKAIRDKRDFNNLELGRGLTRELAGFEQVGQ